MKKYKNDSVIQSNSSFQSTLSEEDLKIVIENKKNYICKIIKNTIDHVQYYHNENFNLPLRTATTPSHPPRSDESLNDTTTCILTLLELYKTTTTQSYENTENAIESLKIVVNKLTSIISCFGTSNIEDILFIVFGIECKDKKYHDPILISKYELIKTHLRPMSYKIINHSNKKNNKFKPITNYCENKTTNSLDVLENSNDLECYDITNVKSFNNKLYGLSVIFQNELHFKTLIIQCITENVIMETIENDYIKYRKNQILKEFDFSKQLVEGNTIEFTEKILQLMTIKDWLTIGNNDLYKNTLINCSEINNSIKNSLNENINYFLHLEPYSQRNFLINLITFNTENKTNQLIAHALYESLELDEFGQTKQKMIFNSFPLIIKEYFKNNELPHKNHQIINNEEFNYNSLKKQIYLLKAPEIVKEKAIIKLKEIKEKNDDNSNKPKQYLEGLLKIPFLTNKEEPFLQKTNKINTLFASILKTDESFNLIELKDRYTNIEILNCIELIKIQLLELLTTNINDLVKKANNTQLTKVIHFLNTETENKTKPKTKTKQEKIKRINEIIDSFQNKNNKSFLFNIYDILNDIPKYSFLKIENEMNQIIEMIKETEQDLQQIYNILDNSIYGHLHAKNQIMKIIGQWMNGEQKGYCFGFEGSPGIGKTSFAKHGLSKCLIDENGSSRPFSFISIGGSCNGSILEGHNYTYANSSWGKIVDILMDSKCMNPIIYIDELDKVSKTENGKEIIGILTHLVDTTQNDIFQDKYFSGINIDLSKVLFIFSYNNPDSIDPILLDRIHRIKFDNLNTNDKLEISNKYIIPEMNTKMRFQNIININNNVLEYIIDNYTQESGVRKLKEIIFDLFGEINLEILKCDSSIKIPIKLRIQSLESKYMKKYTKIENYKIQSEDKIGIINGLWANSYGKGGVIPIEAMFFPSSIFLELKLTGLQGEVMRESMIVAKTLAWNLTSDERKKELLIYFENTKCQGLHINCPDAGISKDGPSAGAAITIAIYSLFNNLKIKNNIAITGEINLQGNICQIGGLDLKIYGGIKSGVTTFLFPQSNEKDYLNFTEKCKNEILNNKKFHNVKNINEVLTLIFPIFVTN
jgi:ATP-dependent Lon protease